MKTNQKNQQNQPNWVRNPSLLNQQKGEELNRLPQSPKSFKSTRFKGFRQVNPDAD
jgi:hypothetical protein